MNFPKNQNQHPHDRFWYSFIKQESKKEYFLNILANINKDIELGAVVFPDKQNILKAFRMSYDNTKVLILGQEPYHNGHADGLAFSSLDSKQQIPASLRNIFKEIYNDVGILNSNKNLQPWTEQGVMLLNTFLTVKQGEPMSHTNVGWDRFTSLVLKSLLARNQPLVVMLWGNVAYNLWSKMVSTNDLGIDRLLVLRAGHPSPLSASRFFGCKHFSAANRFLEQHDLQPILWAT